jgi:hypothetical protein
MPDSAKHTAKTRLQNIFVTKLRIVSEVGANLILVKAQPLC